jgi:hypothetical protein
MKQLAVSVLSLLAVMAVVTPALADWDSSGRHGYREHPYDRHRHYDRFERHGHDYRYRGHWRSWDDWDAFYRDHPRWHRHGHYYRDSGHLMFRFCDPEGGGCFFFSIGR